MTHTNPLRIVSVGGGSGLSTLLRGLKRYVKASEGNVELTAVVTVTDDGGSSRNACAAILMCCLQATSATAWWLFPAMRISSAGSFNTGSWRAADSKDIASVICF